MNPDYIIRPMEVSDTEQVELIEKQIFSIPWSQKSFEDACQSEDNIYLVCEMNGQIAGYCGLWTVLGEGNITNMAVSGGFRRLGIAEALMKEMEKRGMSKNVVTYFLEVRKSNEAAVNLYKKMGYVQIGVRKNFYEKPVEDALVMSKTTD
ncbi:MAG: ribosomal protein S18-alanine N-acetyltransferase [Clostridia bacterium]|nr:ribosomal protein S18-alanine N-acetyltransferase [Clostridia bacterium]